MSQYNHYVLIRNVIERFGKNPKVPLTHSLTFRIHALSWGRLRYFLGITTYGITMIARLIDNVEIEVLMSTLGTTGFGDISLGLISYLLGYVFSVVRNSYLRYFGNSAYHGTDEGPLNMDRHRRWLDTINPLCIYG